MHNITHRYPQLRPRIRPTLQMYVTALLYADQSFARAHTITPRFGNFGLTQHCVERRRFERLPTLPQVLGVRSCSSLRCVLSQTVSLVARRMEIDIMNDGRWRRTPADVLVGCRVCRRGGDLCVSGGKHLAMYTSRQFSIAVLSIKVHPSMSRWHYSIFIYLYIYICMCVCVCVCVCIELNAINRDHVLGYCLTTV